MKSIAFIAAKPTIGKRAFVEYYEAHHAPLAARLLRFQHYRRNHVISGEALGFATVSEFWSDGARIARAMQGPAGETLREDELRFMDKPCNRAARAEQLTEGELPEELAMVLMRGEGAHDQLAQRFRDIGGEVNLLTPYDQRPLPCDAFGFVPLRGVPQMPRGWELVCRAPAIRIAGVGGDLDPHLATKF